MSARPLHVAVDGSGLSRPRVGVGVYTTQILRALAGLGTARLTVYLPAGAPPPVQAPAIAYRELPGLRFAGRHLLWPRRLRRLAPDAYFGPAGQLPLLQVGCPAVITVHDLGIYVNPDWFPPRQPLATRWLVPRSLARADAIIAVSQHTAGDLMALFDVDPNRVTVVHHGVAGSFRPLDAERKTEARARLGLPERFVLAVGTLEPRKNLETLLDGWSMLPERDRREAPLVLAGAWGWRFEGIQARLERLGQGVLRLDAVDPADLPALYNLATCLAHPAWYEGFGLPPLEAMACGTPVICSSASSLPEVVGEAALMVDPGDADAWRAALQRLLGDAGLASGLRRRGILRAAEFSWERAGEKTWRLIERAALLRKEGA